MRKRISELKEPDMEVSDADRIDLEEIAEIEQGGAGIRITWRNGDVLGRRSCGTSAAAMAASQTGSRVMNGGRSQ